MHAKFLENFTQNKIHDIIGQNLQGLTKKKFVEFASTLMRINAPIISKISRQNANGNPEAERRKNTRLLAEMRKTTDSEWYRNVLNNILVSYLNHPKINKLLLEGHRPFIHTDITQLEKEHVDEGTAFEYLSRQYSCNLKKTVFTYPCIVSSMSIGTERLLLNISPVLYETNSRQYSKDQGNERTQIEKEIERISKVFGQYNIKPVFVVDAVIDSFHHQYRLSEKNIESVYRLGYSRGIQAQGKTQEIEYFLRDFIDAHSSLFQPYFEERKNKLSRKILFRGMNINLEYTTTWTHQKYYKNTDYSPVILEKHKESIREHCIVISFFATTKNKKQEIIRNYAIPISLLTFKTYQDKVKKREHKKKTKEKTERTFFVIASSALHLKGKTILKAYRKRWQVETQIKELKDRDCSFHITGFRTLRFDNTKIMLLSVLLASVSICHLKVEKGIRWICKRLSSKRQSFKSLFTEFTGIKNIIAKIKRKYFEKLIC